jgi:hypothetical protein
MDVFDLLFGALGLCSLLKVAALLSADALQLHWLIGG